MNIVPNSTEMLAFTKERGGTAERLSHSTGRGPDRTDTLHAQLEKLKEKTGREWTFPSGPAPKWASSDTESSTVAENDGTKAAS